MKFARMTRGLALAAAIVCAGTLAADAPQPARAAGSPGAGIENIKPLGPDNEHPGYANVQRGQQHVSDIVKAIRTSPYWKDTAIIVTYDENGGRWDHVAPPKGDRWGPGTRVPAIIISAYGKHGFVDHTQYETVSILKFIETRWHLKALGTRDSRANGLNNAFDFSQQPQP